MPLPPGSDLSQVLSPPSASERRVIPPKIVYNIVCNIMMWVGEVPQPPPLRAEAGALTGRDSMAAKSLKPMKAGVKVAERSGEKAATGAAAPARPPTAVEMIARRIEEDIVLGRRHPRERLIELDLCDLFQTHRGDVRLALFELERKGLIERIPNRGAMVRGLAPQ